MKLDEYGNLIYQEHDIVNLFYNRKTQYLSDIFPDSTPEIREFYSLINQAAPSLPAHPSLDEFDAANQATWFIPEDYKNLDILEFCINLCNTEEEKNRVTDEFNAFEEKKLIPLLQTLKYIVDVFRENNILWGVGRGSSVSSYILFLLGIHKIDSIKYSLDYKEFLR